jgi:peroxiredoxin
VYNPVAEENAELVEWEETHVKQRYGSAFIILGVLLFSTAGLANTPPIASFEVHAAADGSATTVVLDASASTDPDGSIVTYGWNFGDATSGSGKISTHTFPSASTYTVTLNVIDNSGGFHQATRTIDLTQLTGEPAQEAPATVQNVVVPLNIPIGFRVGERAPAFALPNQDGEIVELSDFLGHVVLVEFWSSSCSACQAAMPHLEELRAEFEDRGLVVIPISINRNYEGEWTYLAEHGFTQFTALREADPVGRPIMAAYNVSRIPQAFLVDQQGVIRFAGHLNLVQSDMIEALI